MNFFAAVHTSIKMENENKLKSVDMVEEILIDFGPICRFCLTETDSNISILNECFTEKSSTAKEYTIIGFVLKHTQIKMNSPKNFPTLVCRDCYELINGWHNFILMCQQSDDSLRECYQQTLNEAKAKLQIQDGESGNSGDLSSVWQDENVPEKEQSKGKLHALNDNEGQVLSEINLKSTFEVTNINNPISPLKADSLKPKCQKISSLTERLKEAQIKLKEDILRSNDLMLETVKRDNSDQKTHGKKESHCCLQCSSNYSSAEALRLHFATTHGQSKQIKNIIRYQCKKCIKNFSQQEKLLNHYRNSHSEFSFSQQDINFVVPKTPEREARQFYCIDCTPHKFFSARDELLNHFKDSHQGQEDDRVYSCNYCDSQPFPSSSDLNNHFNLVHNAGKASQPSPKVDKSSPSNLFKIFVCTLCSPPVSFANADACLKHKMSAHDAQLECISSEQLPAVYVDSFNVFKHNEEDFSMVPFKILCRNCHPEAEFTSTRAFISHMHSQHDKEDQDNWDIESSKAPMESGQDNGRKKPDEKMWKCSECPSAYFRKHSLSYHMKEKHNKTVKVAAAKCPDCDESFFTTRRLVQHGISAHQKYFAHFHKVFKKKILDLNTDPDENKLKTFECDICQKKYSCKNSWKRHVLKAHLGKTDSETVVCSYCGKTLSNKLNLKSHIEFVHEALFVSCPICKKEINFRTIGKHYKTHRTTGTELAESVNEFLCNLCGKILKSKKSFEDHQKLHENIRDQLCDVCGSGFTTKKFLYLHKKTHEGSQRKVFGCSQCEKVFSGRHTLNRHLLTHSGEKNFICEICSKCFYTLQELNRHVRYHKKEYRFDCQLCDMRFLDKSRFRHHMMRHRNIRPHKCQFCDKMFIVKRKMNLHMAAKHNVQVKSTKGVWKDPKTYVPLDDLL